MRCFIESTPVGFKISGDIGFDNANQIFVQGEWLIKQWTEKNITLNLQGVSTCGMAALCLLTSWLRSARGLDKVIHFCHLPDSLVNLIQITGMGDILPESE